MRMKKLPEIIYVENENGPRLGMSRENSPFRVRQSNFWEHILRLMVSSLLIAVPKHGNCQINRKRE